MSGFFAGPLDLQGRLSEMEHPVRGSQMLVAKHSQKVTFPFAGPEPDLAKNDAAATALKAPDQAEQPDLAQFVGALSSPSAARVELNAMRIFMLR